jgi:hypothetical protein
MISGAVLLLDSATSGGENLLDVDFHIKASASIGQVPVDVQLVKLDDGQLMLASEPDDGPDPSDGLIDILPIRSLDIDANGQVSALTDGVLLVRYLFGVRDTALTQGALTQGALAPNAHPLRDASDEIQNYVALFMQPSALQGEALGTGDISSASALKPIGPMPSITTSAISEVIR